MPAMCRGALCAVLFCLALGLFNCHPAVGDQEVAIREQIEKGEYGICNPKDRNPLHRVTELWLIGQGDEQLKLVRELVLRLLSDY